MRGESTIAGPYYSVDGQRTWRAMPELPVAWQWSDDTSGVFAVAGGGLQYLDLVTGARVMHAVPAGTPWLVVGPTLVTMLEETVDASVPGGPGVRPVLHTIPVDGGSGASWATVSLPVMPVADRSYLPSLHHGADGDVYVVARYGMVRGVPASDAEWEFFPLYPAGATISWSDNPVWVSRGGTIVVSTEISFDGGASFDRRDDAGQAPWTHQEVNGVLTRGSLVSDDDGRTWESPIEPALLARLAPQQASGIEAVRYRAGTVYATLGDYTYVAVRADGRMESFAPYVPDDGVGARNAEDHVALPDGRILALASGQLLRYTPDIEAWEWLSNATSLGTLHGLSDGRVAHLYRENGVGQVRFSDDAGSSWTEPRAAPVLTHVFEFDDGWLGQDEGEGQCAVNLYATTDEFETWEALPRTTIAYADGTPHEQPYEFAAEVLTPDGALFGNAVGLYLSDSACFSGPTAGPARSHDRGANGRLMVDDETFRADVVAVNSRGGVVALLSGNQEESVYLHRGGRWVHVGTPHVEDEELRVNQAPPFFDVDDHLVVPSAYGLVRTVAPLR
ncbi:MAG: hypothetical protein H6726_21085 [Sandaracinaceae bacterium]|nr:hypothetical protein [Sandaracinaceae bacterium]